VVDTAIGVPPCQSGTRLRSIPLYNGTACLYNTPGKLDRELS
jgi:hypothetical protein